MRRCEEVILWFEPSARKGICTAGHRHSLDARDTISMSVHVVVVNDEPSL